ncbi:hypothetical protein AB0J84_31385, partial [Micromonospora arborensis]|uniref:hypothetical protein n=1 Tax=Micromonospora arborensis TaxID=2116518 RepID=UPI00343202E4
GPRLAAGASGRAGTVAAAIDPQVDERLKAAAQRVVSRWDIEENKKETYRREAYQWLRNTYAEDDRFSIDDRASIASGLPEAYSRMPRRMGLAAIMGHLARREAEGGLSPDQFAMLIKEPRLLGLMLVRPKLAVTYAENFPNLLDKLLHFEGYEPIDLDLLQHFVDRKGDIVNRLENDYHLRQLFFWPAGLEAMRRLGDWSHLVFPYRVSFELSRLLAKSSLAEAIISSPDPAVALRGVTRSPGLVEELSAAYESAPSSWSKEQFGLLFQDPRFLDVLRRNPAAVGAVVRVPGMLAAAVANLDVVSVLNGNPDLADVLIDSSPVFGERLAGSIELLREAAGNRWVAARLSRNPAYFDTRSSEELLVALRGATAPPQVAPLKREASSAETKALAQNSVLRAAVLDPELAGDVRKRRWSLLKDKPDLANFLAANPDLLSHPHEYGRLLDATDGLWQKLLDKPDTTRPLLPILLRSRSMRRRITKAGGEDLFLPVAQGVRDNPAYRRALLLSSGLRFVTAEYLRPLGLLVLEMPALVESLARDEGLLAVASLGYSDVWRTLFQDTKLGSVVANDEGMLRLLVQNLPLALLVAEVTNRLRVSEMLLRNLQGRGELSGVLATNSDLLPTKAHWEVLLSAPAFFDYLDSDSELRLAGMLVAAPELLIEIASRPIPQTMVEVAAKFDGPIKESAALRRDGSKDWSVPLRVVIEGLGARLVSPEGVFVKPEAVPLADILREPADGTAGQAATRAGLSPEKSAEILAQRTRVRQHPRLVASIERHPALAAILVENPLMVDVLGKLPGLLGLLDGPDALVVFRSLQAAPKFFEAMLKSDPLYHFYLSDGNVRGEVSSEGDRMARQTSIFQIRRNYNELSLEIGSKTAVYKMMFDFPSVAEVLLAHRKGALELLAREGFAGVLAAQGERVVDAAVSHLSLLRFLSAHPGEVSTLGSVPALAEAFLAHRYDLTDGELASIFRDPLKGLLVADPGLVERVFSSVDVLRAVVAAPVLASALADPAVHELVRGRKDVRRLIRRQPAVAGVLVERPGDWVPALRGRELVRVLTGEPAVSDLFRQHPFLLSAVRDNRALLPAVAADSQLREALGRNEVLAGELGSGRLSRLRVRPGLVGVLAGTTAVLDAGTWSRVLSDANLLQLLNAWPGFARRFLTEPQFVESYRNDSDRSDRFVETVRRLQSLGRDVSTLTVQDLAPVVGAGAQPQPQPQPRPVVAGVGTSRPVESVGGPAGRGSVAGDGGSRVAGASPVGWLAGRLNGS